MPLPLFIVYRLQTGVILVTTKRRSEGKLKVSVTINNGWSSPTIIPKMAYALFATQANEIYCYRGQLPDILMRLFKL